MLRRYKETPRPAGVFAVRNTVEGTMLIGVSTDLPGILNRQRFQLEMGSHPDKALQSDWNRLGPDAFVIEVLDQLEPPVEQAGYDARDELDALREMWFERLSASGQQLYASSTRRA